MCLGTRSSPVANGGRSSRVLRLIVSFSVCIALHVPHTPSTTSLAMLLLVHIARHPFCTPPADTLPERSNTSS